MSDVKYSVKTFVNSEVIVREFSGDIGVKDILTSFKYISKNLLSDRTIGLITDTRKAKLKMVIPGLARVISYLIRNKKIRRLKMAVLVDSPEITIVPMLVKSKLSIMDIQAFSSDEAALKWMLE